jgi:hypothetical protein
VLHPASQDRHARQKQDEGQDIKNAWNENGAYTATTVLTKAWRLNRVVEQGGTL